MLALDEDIPAEEVTTSVYDGYKFSLEKVSTRYIKFQVVYSHRLTERQIWITILILDVFQLLDLMPKIKFYKQEKEFMSPHSFDREGCSTKVNYKDDKCSTSPWPCCWSCIFKSTSRCISSTKVVQC